MSYVQQTATFDHHSPHFATHWRSIFATLREECPVARSEAHGGFHVLSTYADVERAFKDDATFSSRHIVGTRYAGITIPESPHVSMPIEMDPPEYTPYRKALNPWFSPARSLTYEPFTRSVTTALIDHAADSGRIDLVKDLASPVPAILTAKMLGVPLADWQIYADSAHGIVTYPPGTPDFDDALQKHLAVLGRCQVAAEERRADPRDDLMTLFVTMEVDGERLSVQRVVEICNLVIAGGNDTTTSLLANSFAWLSEHPAERRWLAEDPSRIPKACEEFLRYFSPTQSLARTVTRPTMVGGCPLGEGDRVLLGIGGANLDPATFDRPDEVILDRTPNRHQSFGLGLHRCLGSNLTRMEFRVVMEEVLTRLPDFVVDFEHAQPYRTIGYVNGWVDMPATFTPTRKRGSDFQL